MNLFEFSLQNYGILPNIDIEKMKQAETSGKRIILGHVWTDYNYDYGFVAANDNTTNLSETKHLDDIEGVEILNVFTDENHNNGLIPGEFERNGTGSSIKCIRAYAVPKDLILFQWNWNIDPEYSGVYALEQHFDFVKNITPDVTISDFTITSAEWIEFTDRVTVKNMSTLTFC